jgi:hypothetical protein
VSAELARLDDLNLAGRPFSASSVKCMVFGTLSFDDALQFIL